MIPELRTMRLQAVEEVAGAERVDAERLAQFADEALRIGELRSAGVAPCSDEGFDRINAAHADIARALPDLGHRVRKKKTWTDFSFAAGGHSARKDSSDNATEHRMLVRVIWQLKANRRAQFRPGLVAASVMPRRLQGLKRWERSTE